MGTTFNTQILVEKLARMNCSQQSIETLSHWCIFHMHKAKQVVETWDRQFHCSPREQRLAFLYLANDILQNSRRKGSEFVGEFWKVLPDALRDVIESEDEFARNAAIRMVSIWEERKVFGSRGHILKEEFVGKQADNGNREGKHHTMYKLRQVAGSALDRIVSSYQIVSGGQVNEDSVMSKCRNAISCIEKVGQEVGGDSRSGPLNSGSVSVDEVKGQLSVLRDCIEQLTSIESLRANLVTYLREALQEQEYKLDQVRNQLQAAHVHSEQADDICRRFISSDSGAEQDCKETHLSPPLDFASSGNKEQSAPVMYSGQVSYSEKPVEEEPKSAAAAVAAKLTASSSSAQMLTYVLSSLASEGVIGNHAKESSSSSGDYLHSEKRPKLENNDHTLYIPQNPQGHQTAVPPYSQPEQPPLPPSSPPPLPPLPPMQPYPVPQYMPSAAAMSTGPYGYGAIQQLQSSPSYPPPGPPGNGFPASVPVPSGSAYQNYPADGGNSFYSQPMAPVTRQ
ncbi:OLC1v1011892C2 [Oldenlandia corymbosa var. corymbosa]|nr:OLC1v1011892C2 [Oldenlandia corymbosa var. corymbosa]